DIIFFFFSSRRRHTRFSRDWSSDVCSSDLRGMANATFFSFFDLGVGIGAILFGQIAHSFGYHTIYGISALSVCISMLIYIFIVRSEERRVGKEWRSWCL